MRETELIARLAECVRVSLHAPSASVVVAVCGDDAEKALCEAEVELVRRGWAQNSVDGRWQPKEEIFTS